ncbi:MAG: hypothetical protein IJO34_07200 [Akkermansia sp.]|nr:hypothetical protein [Akkermansia sp.]
MMKQFSHAALFSLMALGALSAAPCLHAQEADASTTESARRQMAVRDAMQELQEARLAYQARRYSDAVEHYRNALSVLPKAPASAAQEKFIKESLSDALIAKAIDYRTVGRKDEAISFLKEALELAPDNQRAKVELVHTSDPVRTNPALTPQHVGDVEEVSRLLTLGYGYLDLGKYDEAIQTFQAVAKYDQYNSAARRGIEQAHKRRSQYYRTAHDTTRAHMLEKVDAEWREEDYADEVVDMQVQGEAAGAMVQSDAELFNSYAERLENMVMPSIVFDDAGIMDVIDALQNQIRRFESQNATTGRSINITSNFGTPNTPGYKELMERTVRLNLSQVSVKAVLDLLASQLDINYYFTPTGVELSYSGKNFGPMVDRTFFVPPHFFDAPADGGAEDDEEDDAFSDGGGTMKIQRVNPVAVLKSMGISFPEGSNARYLPAARQLRVRNTAHNMADIEELLSVPLEGERQVVLSVTVMEVSETDLNELGFEWLLNVSLNGENFLDGGVQGATSAATGVPTFSTVTHPENGQIAPSISNGLRTGTKAIGISGMDKLISTGSAAAFGVGHDASAPAIFGIRGVWNAADVTMIMRGLSQKKGVDILQNPRIVFSPGAEEQITFANVKELFFPESYEQGEIQMTNGRTNYETGLDGKREATGSSSGNVIATGATPQDFVRFGMTEEGIGGVGTIMQIHSAEVSEGGQHVTVALTTTVNEFEGFINWGSPINAVVWSADNEDNIVKLELSPNRILMPMIKRYRENTKVTVVPGTVLVLGGLKEAKMVRYEDKIPVLGDLPLVGRLFRSSGEEKVRKALLFFAKIDVVDPTGRDVKTGKRPDETVDNM